MIKWRRGQLKPIYTQVDKHKDVIFFTYPTIDNYFNHHWYNLWDEEENFSKDSFFRPIPPGIIYSWYKGNVYPHDMETKILRKDHMICLFNNSASGIDEHINEIDEVKKLWLII